MFQSANYIKQLIVQYELRRMSLIYGILKKWVLGYNSTMMKYPLRTSMITAAFIRGSSDYAS